MADSVLFEAGDGLSESNLAKFFGQPNIVDYVVRGVSSSVDFGNNTVDYTTGELIVTDSNNQAYLLEVDARSGLSLTDSATNHVFVEYDPTTDDAITFTINTTGTNPTDPHVKIEEVDTSADTSTEFNRNPDVGIDQLTDDVDANSNDITNVGAIDTDRIGSGGGVTTTDITDLEGPGIRVNGSNQLESDAEIPSDVSGSRSIGTWETNQTGNPLVLYVSLRVSGTNMSADERLEAQIHVNSSQTDNTIIRNTNQTSDGSAMTSGVTAVVPDGAEYKASMFYDGTDSDVEINDWNESEIGA